MARPDLELSLGLREWATGRQLEVDLSQSLATHSKELEAEQYKNRQKALEDFTQGITCDQYLYFASLASYFRTHPEDRTPEDTKDYKFKLDYLIQKFGDRYIPYMRREWEKSFENKES